MDSYALLNFTRQELELFVSRNYIDANTQKVLEKITISRAAWPRGGTHRSKFDQE